MRRVETAIPDSPQIADFLRAQRPELMLISPLVTTPSQAHYIRAARSLGIPSALLVWSWDNLTNKGLIRELPDRVYVWNEDQRREAIELHGVPPERVVATGAYPWDQWFGRRPSTSATEFREWLGLAPGRPIVLYVCSSKFIAPDEPRFVERWLRALREHPDERLRTAGVVVRPHPKAPKPWWDRPLAGAPGVAVWPPPRPREGPPSVDEQSKSAYFDSIHHSSAVVGLNTSALIEAAIVGRPVLTVRSPEYRDTQEGTLHFHYLPRENGGPLTVARDFPEHFAQLAEVLAADRGADGSEREFVHQFVRPHGVDRPAVPILVDALEAQLDVPPRPTAGRTGGALATIVLRPLAVLADWSVRPRRHA
jgi:hypothetical protein